MIRTHYQDDSDYNMEQHVSDISGKPARWWSQNESGEKALGPVVWHTKSEREKGRKLASERSYK